MIDLGLSRTQLRALLRTLASDHEVGVEVQLMDLDHQHISRLFTKAVSGQVLVDTSASVTRQLQMELVDERGVINVDSDDGRPRVNRMIRVYYMVKVEHPSINDWVAIPVFTGPCSVTKRDGAILTLEALGKESLSNKPTGRARTYAQNRNRVEVIKEILEDLGGETRFRFPKGSSARLRKPLSIKKTSGAWQSARRLSRSMRLQLFYDGRGVTRLRRRPTRPVFTFRDGNGGMILTRPVVSENSADIINHVVVTGAVPKGKKEPLTGEAYLPEGHMYSPRSLRRGGKDTYRTEEISDDTLRSKRECQEAAEQRRDEILIDEQSVTFDSLPMPLLEEEDPIVVDSRDVKVTARVNTFSIGLGHSGTSTIGYHASLKKRKRAYSR